MGRYLRSLQNELAALPNEVRFRNLHSGRATRVTRGTGQRVEVVARRTPNILRGRLPSAISGHRLHKVSACPLSPRARPWRVGCPAAEKRLTSARTVLQRTPGSVQHDPRPETPRSPFPTSSSWPVTILFFNHHILNELLLLRVEVLSPLQGTEASGHASSQTSRHIRGLV
jgi:hypothetical protein